MLEYVQISDGVQISDAERRWAIIEPDCNIFQSFNGDTDEVMTFDDGSEHIYDAQPEEHIQTDTPLNPAELDFTLNFDCGTMAPTSYNKPFHYDHTEFTEEEMDQIVPHMNGNMRFAHYTKRYTTVKHEGEWTVRDFCAGVLKYRQVMHTRGFFRNPDHMFYEGCSIDGNTVTVSFGS